MASVAVRDAICGWHRFQLRYYARRPVYTRYCPVPTIGRYSARANLAFIARNSRTMSRYCFSNTSP